MSVLAVYRHPFAIKPKVEWFENGQTVLEMREKMPDLDEDFDVFGSIRLNGDEVPRALWGAVRVKPVPSVPVEVTFHMPPLGGSSGDSGKGVLAIVASIALTAGAGFILSGGLATSGGLFAKGSLSAAALASGVSLAGSLIVGGLVSPPAFSAPQFSSEADDDQPGSAGVGANILEPNGPIMRVIGRHRVLPRLASEALVYYDGEDEVAEAIYCLAGPHEISNIRLADAPINGLTDFDIEVREGWPGDAPLSLLRRYGRTESIQNEIRGHLVSDTNGQLLESATGSLTDALPLAATVATRSSPDEMWLDIALPSGLHLNASETIRIRVPFRIRIRQVGADEWINLPELHYQAARLTSARGTIKLIWQDGSTATPTAAVNEGWVEARHRSPGQSVSPAGPDRDADPYFATTGDAYMSAVNLGTTGVQNVELDRYTASYILDTAVFPKGRYEVEVVRGYAFRNSNYGAAAYTISGSQRDPFAFENVSTPQISQTADGIADTVYFLRAVSVWNEDPATVGDCALIAVRSRNRRVDRLSVEAAGYVLDWDGSAWSNWVTTSNPAPHYRDVMNGMMNMKPVPNALIDDTGLLEWRNICEANSLECNMQVLGKSVGEVLRVIASCGYARPYMSDTWGIVRDYDRTGESPEQIFTPRNSSGFSYTRGISDMPDGLRVTFADRDDEYQSSQITVFRDGVSDDSGLVEQVSYQGLVTEEEVRKKAVYDIRQAEGRATFYTLEASADSIVCRKGSLVGVVHDMISDLFYSGRITGLGSAGGGLLSSITIDDEVTTYGAADVLSTPDMLVVPDVLKLGARLGVVIRGTDGSLAIHELDRVDQTSKTLTFASDIPDAGVALGSLVTVGRLTEEMRRFLVFNITPREDLNATITLVDEAPEIWT